MTLPPRLLASRQPKRRHDEKVLMTLMIFLFVILHTTTINCMIADAFSLRTLTTQHHQSQSFLRRHHDIPRTTVLFAQEAPDADRLEQVMRQMQQRQQQISGPDPPNPPSSSSLHPITLNAIAEGLRVRATNDPRLPLREETEEWELYLTAGKLAQSFLGDFGSSYTQDEQNTIGGRIVAVLIRLPVLEDTLRQTCLKTMITADDGDKDNQIQQHKDYCASFGLLLEEVEGDEASKSERTKLLDKAIQSNLVLTKTRAESLLALFLDMVERPGFAASGEVAPDESVVDFLQDHRDAVLLTKTDKDSGEQPTATTTATVPEVEVVPDLSAVLLAGVVGALQLRAENKRFSPLRKQRLAMNGSGDYEDVPEVQLLVTAGRVADEAMQDVTLRPKEAELVGSRIVAISLRLEELEDELYERCSGLLEQQQQQKNEERWARLGFLLSEDADSIDSRIQSDATFCMRRAQALLGHFLEDYERPALEESDTTVPDNSRIDFLDEELRQIVVNNHKDST